MGVTGWDVAAPRCPPSRTKDANVAGLPTSGRAASTRQGQSAESRGTGSTHQESVLFHVARWPSISALGSALLRMPTCFPRLQA
eukprot:353460-Chlamydomonas_euryale.AAC.14